MRHKEGSRGRREMGRERGKERSRSRWSWLMKGCDVEGGGRCEEIAEKKA